MTTRRERRTKKKKVRQHIGNRADVRAHKKIKHNAKRGTAFSQRGFSKCARATKRRKK